LPARPAAGRRVHAGRRSGNESVGDRYDFVSRFFAPTVGVNEDPVTGSAHCCLGPYWAATLGKSDLLAHQCSARGGVVRVSVRGDRVLLGGQAVTVQRGQFLVG
jgi:predicted PhzF superfamily epimerase YddE/YHI9